MSNQQPIQINIDPNLYAISLLQIVSTEEDFRFLIVSGNQGRQYLASPKHAKRMLLLLQQQIEAYEKKFGELETSLPKTKGQTEQKTMGFQSPSS